MSCMQQNQDDRIIIDDAWRKYMEIALFYLIKHDFAVFNT